MKPFILEFAEKPLTEPPPSIEIEYCQKLNLNVFKGSSDPAIARSTLSTETFTRTGGESSDTDESQIKSGVNYKMDTSTCTLVNNESPDSDRDLRNLSYYLDTNTLTETKTESTDTD